MLASKTAFPLSSYALHGVHLFVQRPVMPRSVPERARRSIPIHSLKASCSRLALLLVMLVGLLLVGCGEENEEGSCPSDGHLVTGMGGIVLSPNCSTPVIGAEVSALHGSGVTLTTSTSADGSFSFSNAVIPEEGRWQLSVRKGPFRGEEARLVTVKEGKSSYVLFKLAQ